MSSEAKILDITNNSKYEKYLYSCLAPMPFRKSRKRQEYLKAVVSKGFRKKLLIFRGEIAGQIEYAPAEASGFPINADNVIVMNCIWVLRKAKGHNFGKKLFADMVKNERETNGFATVGLENHWSPWMIKWQMERFDFKSIDSIEVMHNLKHIGECFKIHLMWLPTSNDSKSPSWDKKKLLEGVNFCIAHPLYHPEKARLKELFEKC